MKDDYDFDRFDAVWQRVTALDAELPPLPEISERREEQLCLIKASDTSCAVRFIPKF